MNPRILKSEIDPSVNFVWDIAPGEALEARYVRRKPEYLACYLSTQTGCAQACRMCHLTATGQNHPRDASFNEVIEQARTVLDYYSRNAPGAATVHFNFMARGEPLSSDLIVDDSRKLFLRLGDMAASYGLLPRFLISTIMPKTIPFGLPWIFPDVHPEIYYSLYSMDPKFRKRWLPRAMEAERALDALKEWQRHTKKIVRIHHALISGENDNWVGNFSDVRQIAEAVRKRGLRADFTLVRYNPPGEKYGSEPDQETYQRYAAELQTELPMSRIKTIDRVGFDVAASCGMFVNP
jgi:adenine C2-methylase RlmN of 23S rRNA A2503 and tRNA A37